MNYGRLALAAVAAWVVDGVYGFIVYGNVLGSEFSRYPGVYRQPGNAEAYMPFLFAGTLFAMLVAAYIYAKGYEGGSGLQEGMRFGVLIGLFVLGYECLVNYAILNIGRRVAGGCGRRGMDDCRHRNRYGLQAGCAIEESIGRDGLMTAGLVMMVS